eukprot:TRINITY_DN15860_c0_g1_i1.p1 TRINITY_DN15860_c0_g1~~TRINITY_DN15860_c0_g1_i1.p1  ORF type:complete len:267 (-),score=46.34 TRINITY_DN15860_c0_g1_i1:81-860(-)
MNQSHGHLATLVVVLALVVIITEALSAPPDNHVITISACPPDLNWNSTNQMNITTINNFVLDDGSGPAIQPTTVRLCYDNQYLHVRYDCIDNNINSPYTQCNDDVFFADVVEMFINPTMWNNQSGVANGTHDNLHQYIEIDLSPHSVIFISEIANPNLTCDGIVGQLIDCQSSGIIWSSAPDQASNTWWGELQVPWELIAKAAYVPWPPPSLQDVAWRLNFFRIDTPLNEYKEYSCWSSTFSDPPCFHKPLYFGTMYLQ